MKITKLFVSILIPLCVGFVGSIFTTPNIPTWYASLNKPSFNPPNWIFAPVWTTLFILMGISFFLIWRNNDIKKFKTAFIIFSSQLLLNMLWSILFFGLKNPLLAFVDIIFLAILIILNIIYFYKKDKISGILLVPYILWVSFASVLNYSIIALN